MSTREIAKSIFDCLSDEQLKGFIAMFRPMTEIPNEETLEAMLEADRIAHDPNAKSYTDIDEMIKEILDE